MAAELGGQDVAELGYWSALLTLPVLLVSMTTVLVVVSTRPSARHVVLGAAVVVTQWAALVAANAAVGVPPSGILASTAVIALLLGVGRARHGVLPAVTAELGRALIPFAVLLAGILGASAVLALAGAPAGTGWLTSPPSG